MILREHIKTTRKISKTTQRVRIAEMWDIHNAQGKRCHLKYGNKTEEGEVEEGEISTCTTAGGSRETSRHRSSINDQKNKSVSVLDY